MLFTGLTFFYQKNLLSDYPFIKVTFSFFLLFITPGFLLSRILPEIKGLNNYGLIPLYFCLSVGIIAVPGLIALYHKISIDNLLLSIFIILIFFFIFWIIERAIHRKESPKNYSNDHKQHSRVLIGMLILIIIATTLFSLKAGGYFYTETSDTWYHISKIRKDVESPFISPSHFRYKDAGFLPGYGCNIWNLSMALLSRISDIDPLDIWNFMPFFLTPIAILSFYALGLLLFKNSNISVIATIIYVAHTCLYKTWYWYWQILPYPNQSSWHIFSPVMIILVFLYIRRRNILYAFLTIILGFTLATVHIGTFFYTMLSIAFFILMNILLKWKESKPIVSRLFLVLSVTSFFALLYYYLFQIRFLIQQGNWISGVFDKSYYMEIFFKQVLRNVYIADPGRMLEGLLPLTYLAALFLLPYVKKKDGYLYLFSNTLIVPFVFLNPLAIYFISYILSLNTVFRVVNLSPSFYLFGFLLNLVVYKLISKLSTLNKSLLNIDFTPRKKMIGIVILVFLFMVPATIYGPQVYNKLKLKLENSETNYNLLSKEPFLNLRNIAPQSSIVLSDPRTSFNMTAWANVYVVACYKLDWSILPDTPNRIYAIHKVLDPETSVEDTLYILNYYDVKTIFLDLYRSSKEKFEKNPQFFKKAYEDEDYAIYVLTDSAKTFLGSNNRVLEEELKKIYIPTPEEGDRLRDFLVKSNYIKKNSIYMVKGYHLLEEEDKPEEALIYFEKVIKIMNWWSEGYYAAARAYWKLGRWDDAIDMLEKSMLRDTFNNADLRWKLGRCYIEIGEYKKAVYWLRKAFKMSPEGRTERLLNKAIRELEKQKKLDR